MAAWGTGGGDRCQAPPTDFKISLVKRVKIEFEGDQGGLGDGANLGVGSEWVRSGREVNNCLETFMRYSKSD